MHPHSEYSDPQRIDVKLLESAEMGSVAAGFDSILYNNRASQILLVVMAMYFIMII